MPAPITVDRQPFSGDKWMTCVTGGQILSVKIALNPQQIKSRHLALPQRLRGLLVTRAQSISERDLLDRFWQARGVWEPAERANLVSCIDRHAPSGDQTVAWAGPLPGVGAASRINDPEGLAEVQNISNQLVRLFQALGSRSDLDVVAMVTKEPRLLGVSAGDVMRRLIQMKVAAGEQDVDVAKIAEEQPALLLADHVATSSELQGSTDQLAAWRHGIASDGSVEWQQRLSELQAYVVVNGDPHVGYRAGDDPDLGRWARAQRAAFKEGRLTGDRIAMLEAVGFEFDDEAAEWGRWYNELAAFHAAAGHCSPTPLASSSAFLLINWCSVQRIAYRSRVLSPARVTLLEALSFDWTSADALS